MQTLFGARPKIYQYSEEMLADRDLDAVIVSTGDHQHARILAEVVKAGKDCYCEKPMANTLEDAKLARDTVKASGRIVQMGSQWLSDPYQQQVRELIRGGKIGKVVSISQSWNFNGPRWHVPKDENIAAIREQDTDWKRWLLGRPARPFDPRVYFEFRIFKDFSGGITDQWYSHGSGLAHFYLDTFIPDETVAMGGIFAWHDVRENPDTFQCISSFNEKEVLYTYATTFGNGYGDHTIIRGTRGTLYSPGGEGSPQWWFLPETKSEWRTNQVFDLNERRGQAAARDRKRPHGAAADFPERRSPRAHRQLARVHPQPEGAERQHRHRIRARRRRRDGDAKLPRGQEVPLGPEAGSHRQRRVVTVPRSNRALVPQMARTSSDKRASSLPRAQN